MDGRKHLWSIRSKYQNMGLINREKSQKSLKIKHFKSITAIQAFFITGALRHRCITVDNNGYGNIF
jgi:hypothetical protein